VSSPRTSHDVEVDERAGYWALIVGNRNFRRLWVGNVISLLGDWFNTLALYVLVTELTGSPLALGAVFIIKMLPWSLSAPLAGVIVDRSWLEWICCGPSSCWASCSLASPPTCPDSTCSSQDR